MENRAFLRLLRRTGNVRETVRRMGAHRATFTKRRAAHPAFAAAWDAALAQADARLNDPSPPTNGASRKRANAAAAAAAAEPLVQRTPSGRLQLRRPGGRHRVTRDAEQAFLAALSATANIRWSAAAAGFSPATFHARRKASPAFAREMRLALEMGYDRIEMALIASWSPDSHADDAWRHNDPPPIPPMSANQALQLLYLHQKQARLLAEPDHIKRRKGESNEARSFRLSAMYEARLQRDREAFELAEAARLARGEPGYWSEAPPALPDLAQVTGWSKADPKKAAHHEDVALFGGWRLGDRAKGD